MPLIKCSLVIKSNTIQPMKGDRGTFKQMLYMYYNNAYLVSYQIP